MSTKTEKPFVWSDEDGDYWGEGHIEPEHFKALCLAYDIECLGPDHDSMDEGCGEMEPARVTHGWWRQDPDNEELMHRCAPDHPAAQAITGWRRYL